MTYLGLRVVAEGSRPPSSWPGCAPPAATAQGFFLARPMTLDDTGRFLQDAQASGPVSPRRRVDVLPVPAA